ncbi:MAG TPA: bifunctional NADH-specific enoyl-ACP reductase/trans-2-enoyl-CoA reductase, partial [Spirochaeta sp.]|nr:bifunctional NADH-specific enoyl-ACP reductase/trans-2-enoyl-CoA reductase [Spirochaeta sp.]
MVITPRIRNNICLTAHPAGCAAEVKRQIDYVKGNGAIQGTRSALIIGSSTGYGLSCRVAAAFGCGASTIGVFFEKAGAENRPGTPGYYNMKAFDREAAEAGLFSKSINGDAFSNKLKQETIEAIKEGPGKVDLVIYSLASGVRVDPADGIMYRSAL